MIEDLTGRMLVEFIRTFSASLDPRVWVKLIEEETEELFVALESGNKPDILKEMTDLMYVQIGFNFTGVGAEQLGLIADEEHAEIMTKLHKAQVLYEKAVDFLGKDVNFFEAFRRVHLSNMSKLNEDGFPIRREDGKILKGNSYVEPKLADLLETK